MIRYSTVKSAYGRIYKNRADVENDFINGKDFYLITSSHRTRRVACYCSVRDFEVGEKIEIRYGLHNEKVTMIEV